MDATSDGSRPAESAMPPGAGLPRQELEAFLHASQVLASSLDLTQSLQAIATQAAAVSGIPTVRLFLLEEATQLLRCRIGVGLPVEAEQDLAVPIGQSLTGEAAATRRPLAVSDMRHDPRLRYPEHAQRHGRVSFLGLPVVHQDQLFGVLAFNTSEPRQYTEGEIALLTAFAQLAAAALHHAQVHEAAQLELTDRKEAERTLAERTRQLETVRAISIEITRELDLGRLLELIVRRAVELVGSAAGAVILWDEATQSLVPRAWHGCGDWIAGTSGSLGEGLTGTVAQRRQGMLVNDYAASRYASPTLLEQVPVTAALSEPLLYQNRLLGVVILYHVEPGKTFTEKDQGLLALLAVQVAIAIENARLFAEAGRSFQELQRAQEQLVQTEKLRALGQMSAGMAHDLNNVLAAVLGQAELLQMQAPNPELRESLRTLEMAARDGAHIIRRLQDFGRQQPSQPLATVSLTAIVEQAVDITRPRWKDEPQRRGAVVNVQAAVQHLPPVLGDDTEIREVLTNLILNAVDAMPSGGSLEITGRVVESGAATENSAQWVELYVTDTGTGMTEEVRRRIFEPFFTTKGVHGSGLGLSVVYGIMERHGGHIGVASVVGQGSTFTLRFKLANRDGDKKRAGSGLLPHISRRILLVDDEPHVRKTIAGLLRSAGHAVVEAEGPMAGLNCLAEHAVDLVLTDLGMPDMNGIELAQTIKLQSPTVPVVLLTGWGNRAVRQEIMRGTVDAVLGKPVSREELLACVETCTRDAEASSTA